jgi:hypothetical protein
MYQNVILRFWAVGHGYVCDNGMVYSISLLII